MPGLALSLCVSVPHLKVKIEAVSTEEGGQSGDRQRCIQGQRVLETVPPGSSVHSPTEDLGLHLFPYLLFGRNVKVLWEFY